MREMLRLKPTSYLRGRMQNVNCFISKTLYLRYYEKIDTGAAESMLAWISIRRALNMERNGELSAEAKSLISSGYTHYLEYCDIRNRAPRTREDFIAMIRERDDLLRTAMTEKETEHKFRHVP